MRRLLLALAAVAAASALAVVPAGAITFGQFDGNLHPEVGALIADIGPNGEPDVLCSGSLISPTVFLTAAHCTAYLESIGISDVWVTFDPAFHPGSSRLVPGRYVTDPAYNGYAGPGGLSNPNDLAVVVLSRAITNVRPARLPTAGLLDSIGLRSQTFTAVGYGTVRDVKTTGPNAFYFDAVRRYVTQSFLSLQPSWLTLDMNPSTGSGGTCYGDSGGPHFLGGPTSDLEVSITVTGDASCRATDKTYRLDTPSARAFLGAYVSLP